MPAEVIVDNEYITMWYYPELKLLRHKFHKFTFGDNLREPMLKGVEVFKERGVNKWLSDDRENAFLHPTDRAWADDVWAPQVLSAGWKYWAMVLPASILGQMDMKKMLNAYAIQGLEVRTFAEPETAMAWLESLDE